MFNVLFLYLIAKFRMYMTSSFNSLPDHRILALSKLKASAGDNFNAAKMTHFFFENIVEKGENAFSPFPTMLETGFFLRLVKNRHSTIMG